MKVAKYLIQWLESMGIEHVFTIPGGGCSHIIDALGKSKKLKYIVPLHEQGGAIMADAYAQYTERPAALIVTTGPGATNILTPMVAAWQESTPLIVIGGQVNTTDQYKGHRNPRQTGFQHVRNQEILSSVCVFSQQIDRVEKLWSACRTAEYHTLNKNVRKGPIFLEVPLDIQAAEVPENIPPFNEEQGEQGPSFVYTGKPIWTRFCNLLAKSKKPIILLGNGVRLGGAVDDFYRFIDQYKIPVLTTWKAADLITEDHPLYVGRPGIVASRGSNINQQNADFVLCLGARLDHGQIAYNIKNFAPNAVKFVVDVDSNELYKFENTDGYIITYTQSAKDFLSSQEGSYSCDPKWLEHCKKVYNKYSNLHPATISFKDPINLYYVIDIISSTFKNMADKPILVPGSSGACSEVLHQAIKISKGMRIINSHGLGSMGFGIAASIGVALASKKRVVSIEGDGGFFMNMQELEVAARYRLPIMFIVLNNDGYGSIRATQNNHFGGNLVGTDSSSGLTLPSLEKTAKLFNIAYEKIDQYHNENTHEGLFSTFPFLLENFNYPIIVEIVVEKDHKTLPKVAVVKNESGVFEAASMEYMNPPISEEEMKENLF